MIRIAILLILAVFTGNMGATPALAAKPMQQIFVTSDKCLACHNGLTTPTGQDVSIGFNWESSMMAHSAKDPYWQASVRRECLDHPTASQSIEDECAACHMPMSRYKAKMGGQKGNVFIHLPLLPAAGQMARLAEDGVSCSMCHQIQAQLLGSEQSFTAGFAVDTRTQIGQRPAFGPYDIDKGRTRVMQSAAQLVPTKGIHMQDSALCGSCHTLYTHARGPNGEIVGKLPEQVPYLEWRHSDYGQVQSCQSCHMPLLEDPMHITNVLSQPRKDFSRHIFRGGNFLMPLIFNQNRNALKISTLTQNLVQTARETRANLTTSAARLSIRQKDASSDFTEVQVKLTNLAGHKLPTAYPSRRTWIHLTATDGDGHPFFESGALNADGSITGNDNDLDPHRFEPHYALINEPDQVQIYEPIMVDSDGNVTTGLLKAIQYVKDNRLLPFGFDKTTATTDIDVKGSAVRDDDFDGGGDVIFYRLPSGAVEGPFTIHAELWYQP
ncbi:MAG: hypothetical protein WBY88_17485, partial [Desulfosarcina sp.]